MAAFDDLPAMMTTHEAAEALRMTQRGLVHLINKRMVKASKVGKRWLVPKTEVLRIMEQGTKPVTLAGDRQLVIERSGRGLIDAADRSGSVGDPGADRSPIEASSGLTARWEGRSGVRAARVIG